MTTSSLVSTTNTGFQTDDMTWEYSTKNMIFQTGDTTSSYFTETDTNLTTQKSSDNILSLQNKLMIAIFSLLAFIIIIAIILASIKIHHKKKNKKNAYPPIQSIKILF